MSLFLDIGQGAGVSGATGVRPFLPVLLTGALASQDKGIDFDGTDYSFLEKPVFLLVVLALTVIAYALGRREPQTADRRPQDVFIERVSAMLALTLGALMFGGSLAAGHETAWWGLIAGVLCAALGYLAVAALFARARARVATQRDAGGAAALIDVYAEGIALVLAALSIFVEPVGYVALVLFLVLLIRSRGEGAQKYGGLRILR
jgi:uncharacterized membrane protein